MSESRNDGRNDGAETAQGRRLGFNFDVAPSL
jgi:hypothetical protein